MSVMGGLEVWRGRAEVTTGHYRSRTLPLSGRERGSGNMDGDLGNSAVKFERSNSALPVNPFKINGSSVRFFVTTEILPLEISWATN